MHRALGVSGLRMLSSFSVLLTAFRRCEGYYGWHWPEVFTSRQRSTDITCHVIPRWAISCKANHYAVQVSGGSDSVDTSAQCHVDNFNQRLRG